MKFFILIYFCINFCMAHDLSIFESYPQNDQFTLSDGRVIDIPIHDHNCQSLLLVGHSPLGVVRSKLPIGLYPVLKNSERARVYLTYLHCKNTSNVPVDEFFIHLVANPIREAKNLKERWIDNVSFLAQKLPILKTIYRSHLIPLGGFTYIMKVKTPQVIFPGSEIWGLPAEMSPIDFSYTPNSLDVCISENDREALKISLNFSRGRLAGGRNYSRPTFYRFYMPDGESFREAKTVVQGKGKIYLLRKRSVSIKYDISTSLGKELADLDFKLENFEWDPDFNNVFGI